MSLKKLRICNLIRKVQTNDFYYLLCLSAPLNFLKSGSSVRSKRKLHFSKCQFEQAYVSHSRLCSLFVNSYKRFTHLSFSTFDCFLFFEFHYFVESKKVASIIEISLCYPISEMEKVVNCRQSKLKQLVDKKAAFFVVVVLLLLSFATFKGCDSCYYYIPPSARSSNTHTLTLTHTHFLLTFLLQGKLFSKAWAF